MTLTPEDVHAKTFGNSRLGRKGYDETEVDDFLDEVFDEMTRITRANEELRTQLAAAERSLAAAQEELVAAGAAGAAPAQVAAAPPPEPAAEPELEPEPAPAPAPEPTRAPTEVATGILALAQRTADEHVAEATRQAEALVSDARTNAERLARETDERQRQVLGALEHDRANLERRVEDLRAFEREYRSRLKSYLEGQLRDLEQRGPAAPSTDGTDQSGFRSVDLSSPAAPAPDESDPVHGGDHGHDNGHDNGHDSGHDRQQ